MKRIFKHKHWLFAFLVLGAISIAMYGCSSYTQLKTPGETNTAPAQLYTLPPGDFGKLWMQRTAKLNMQSPESSSPLFGAGGSDEGGRSDRSIPMNISVTYLDSAIIKTGLKLFENLAEMSPQEKTAYENRYMNQFQAGYATIFWMELSSSYSEDALANNKWTFYVEDDKGNTFEPDKITEVPSQSIPGQLKELNLPGNRASEEHRGGSLRLNKKVFLLSFNKKGSNGNDIVSNAKTLKLVYFEWSTRDFKRIGTLDLTRINSNKIKMQE